MQPDQTNRENAQERTPVDVQPTIRIVFDGLFFFYFSSGDDPTSRCMIGVLTTAPNHEVGITVVELTESDGIITRSKKTIKLDHSMCRRFGTVSLDIESDSSEDGATEPTPEVTRYGYDTDIDRSDWQTEPYNFKWLIDFENGELYSDKLDIIPNIFRPVLYINRGTFFTLKTSDKAYNSLKGAYCNRDEASKYFGFVAETMAVNIDLGPGEKIKLTSGDASLPLPLNEDAKYFIHLRNVRPEHEIELTTADQWIDKLYKTDATTAKNSALRKMAMDNELAPPMQSDPPMKSADGISDFQLYYHAIRNLTILDHYDFDLADDRGAAPLICYPAGGSQTTGT